jgi:hypothetical protein
VKSTSLSRSDSRTKSIVRRMADVRVSFMLTMLSFAAPPHANGLLCPKVSGCCQFSSCS